MFFCESAFFHVRDPFGLTVYHEPLILGGLFFGGQVIRKGSIKGQNSRHHLPFTPFASLEQKKDFLSEGQNEQEKQEKGPSLFKALQELIKNPLKESIEGIASGQFDFYGYPLEK